MARPLRIEYEGAVYHVTSRGNACENIYSSDSDRLMFLDILGEVVSRFGWICHAYCLMSNHYHLVIETPAPNLSKGMQLLNGMYTQRFNRAAKRSGHVFQGRFKAILVEKESYLLELARYVVLNPVRARMVRSARAWPWSSYRATAAQSEIPAFLTVEWLLSQFSRDRTQAIHAYQKFVSQGRGVNVWDSLRGGSLLGSDEFTEQMKPMLAAIAPDPNILRRERSAARPSLDMLFEAATDRAKRNRAVHDAVRNQHYTLREVGDYLGLHFSTISVVTKRVDESRRIQK